MLLLSHFSRVRLCVTPETAAHQAAPSLGFSRQEHWSRLPFPSPMHEGEKWKWSHSVVSDPQRPHGLQPTRVLHPWDFPGKSTGVGCHCLLRISLMKINAKLLKNIYYRDVQFQFWHIKKLRCHLHSYNKKMSKRLKINDFLGPDSKLKLEGKPSPKSCWDRNTRLSNQGLFTWNKIY